MGLNIDKIAPNLFYLDVRVRRPEGPGEDRIRETFQGSKQEAEARYIQLRKDIKDAQAQRCRFDTFGDLMRWYAGERPPADKDQSIIDILTGDLGAVALPAFPGRFADWRKHVLRNPSKKTGRPFTNGTVNRYTNMVKAAFNLAADQEIIEKSPITKAKFPRLREVPRDTVLPAPTKKGLLNVMAEHAPYLVPITCYALQVPCRKSELVNMGKDDLDLFQNMIRVRNGTTKNDAGIWKPIPPDLIGYFRNIPAACPWLFYRMENGQFVNLGDFKKAWATCLRLAGIADFHFHDTRHMSATDLLNNGTPVRTVMEIAGWKTDMLKNYFHRDGQAALGLVKFSPGVRTIGAYTPEKEDEKRVAG